MYSQRTTFFSFSFLLVFLAIGVATAADNSTGKNFSNGTQAFASGDFEKALEWFQKAQRDGLNSSALHYNLGVTYYKLKRYTEARREFERLSEDSNTAALAHYTLGLTGLALGDKTNAENHFQITLRTAKDEKLRRLASDRLQELSTAKKKRVWSGYVSLGAGYSDNVSLVVDGETITGLVDDNFLEFIGSTTGQLSGSRQNGLQLKGSAYYQDYQDANEFDFGDVRIGPELDRKLGKWNTSLAGFVDLSLVDKELFQRIFIAEAKGTREIHQNINLRLRYQLSLIDTETPYDYLSGSRHRMTAGLRSVFWKTYNRLNYTLELNDREDSNFPTRQTLAWYADHDFSDLWSAGVNLSYRYSNYQSTNRLDKRIWFGLQVSRDIPWGFRAFGKFDRMRNDSNLPEQDYTSNAFSIGLERFF